MQTSDRAHVARTLRYVGALVLIELALFGVARVAPAMATLIKPVYWVVAALFTVPIWHATRSREAGNDRRQADRRIDRP